MPGGPGQDLLDRRAGKREQVRLELVGRVPDEVQMGTRYPIQRIAATQLGPYFGGSFGELGPSGISRLNEAPWRRLSEATNWRD